MTSQNKKKGIFIVVGFAIAAAVILFFIERQKHDTTVFSEETEPSSSDSKDKSSVESAMDARKEKLALLRKLQAQIRQQSEEPDSVDGQDTQPPELTPSENQPLRFSTNFERRTTREGIVLDGVLGMMKEGETEKAQTFLKEQRALFPEEDNVETEAFEIISDCIDAKNHKTRTAADNFIKTHSDFRLNKHLKRICVESSS